MTGLNHVIRMGAVYVWRRRITSRADGDTARYLQVSLRTTRFSTAKTLANVGGVIPPKVRSWISRMNRPGFTGEFVVSYSPTLGQISG